MISPETLIASATKFQASPSDLKTCLGLIDLTSLEGRDTAEDIRRLCEKALRYKVSAVCVYPTLVRIAKKELEGSGIKVASVAGGFPSGKTSLDIKEQETKFALDEGADEIDMVIDRGKFLEREYQYTSDEIASLKSLCGKRALKVILETGELKTTESIARASGIAIKAGADFIKTSTGKIPVGATPEAVIAMLGEILSTFEKTGRRVGIKPSGGIPDAPTAALYFFLVREVLGQEWLTPSMFRFGASRLADALSGISNNSQGSGY